jgi:ribulose-phosphate 3-epimerase
MSGASRRSNRFGRTDNMIEIIPAIMPTDFADLCEKASRVKGLVPLAQIDVMDGKFVKSKSWPYREAGNANEAHFLAMGTQDELLPYFDELDYEIDLMIDEPEQYIDEWLPLGASRLIFHIESIRDEVVFWGHDVWKKGARDIGGQKVIEIGLAISPTTPLEALLPHLPKIDLVQCMGIAKIGYQGQPFDEQVLTLINKVRTHAPNMPISVDGGVSLETTPLLRAAGATRLVSGSAVFGAMDTGEAIQALKDA